MDDYPENGDSRRRVVTVGEAASMLRISRGTAYEAARRKQIPTIRIGRRVLVPLAALERMLAGSAPYDNPEGARRPRRHCAEASAAMDAYASFAGGFGSDAHHDRR
jgi:excisionase family DNA binding protein